MVVVLNGLTGTEVLHTTVWSIVPTGDFVQRDERTGKFFLVQITVTHNTSISLTFNAKNLFFNGHMFIAFDKLSSLINSQCNIIENCNLKVTLFYIFYWTGSFDRLFQNWQEFHFTKLRFLFF